MTKYADVFKTLRINDETTLSFNAREVFSRMDDDYEIVDVELVSIELVGTEIQANDLPNDVVNVFLEYYADDNRAEWEYY